MKSRLKDDLKPTGTAERREQISAFLVSEYDGIHNASKSGKLAVIFQKAANYILGLRNLISTNGQPDFPASIACAGVMLILSVRTTLRIRITDIDILKAFY